MVLILDANVELSEIIVEFLEQRGVEAMQTADPAIALRLIEKEKPKVIFFNYLANPMNPEQFFIEAKKLSAASCFVLFTGCAEPWVREDMLRLGVDRVILKPASLSIILGIIEEYVLDRKKRC